MNLKEQNLAYRNQDVNIDFCKSKDKSRYNNIEWRKKPIYTKKSVKVPKYATKCCPGYTGSKCLQAIINTHSIVLNRNYRGQTVRTKM